jgi:hypothetical protein
MCENVTATMSRFELVAPSTLGEVLALRDAADPAVPADRRRYRADG